MKTGYVVADAMTTKPLTVRQDESIKDCALLMKKHDVSSMLIKDDKEVIGIVTGKDYVYKAAAAGLSLDAPVKDIMSLVKYTVSPRVDITEAVKIMNTHRIRHLPVMEHGKLVGYITMTTILKIEPQLFELLVEKIELRGIGPKSPLLGPLDAELSGKCESCGNYSSRLIEDEGIMRCPNCVLH